MSYAIAFASDVRLDALQPDWAARLGGAAWSLDRGEGLLVAASADEQQTWSADRRTVALGLLIDAATNETPAMVDLPRDKAGLSAFLRSFWGRYVLAGSPASGGHWLFRDPSGGQSAYLVRSDGQEFFLSDAVTAASLGIDLGKVDPAFLAHWLAYPFFRTGRTGFEGVIEIQPGELYHRPKSEGRTEPLWTPAGFARGADPAADFEDIAGQLGTLLQAVVPAMIGDARAPMLQLSGGLDSAIIAATLGEAGRSFTAANYFGQSADSDERRFARLAARAARAPLHEFPIPTPMSGAEPLPPSFRPLPNMALRPLFGALARSMGALKADALVDGAGGDNLFCYLTTAAPAVDAFRARGLGAGFSVLDELARLCDATLWACGRAAWHKHRTARTRPYWRRDPRFLQRAAVPDAAEHHPWLEVLEQVPPGKREHIEALVSIQHFLDRGEPLLPAPMRHPLLAQPLLEFCLAVPSWQWCHGGRDRAVARAAMRKLLPPEIKMRRSKGRLESLFLRTYRARQSMLRDQLLGGALAGRGLLDEMAVADYLLQPDDPADDGYIRLLEMAALEQWLRSAGG